MTELPYLSGKIIRAISTIESSGSIDEVRIIHSDGAMLIITGEYIKIRFEPATPGSTRRGAVARTSAVSAVSSGLAARVLEEAIEQGKAIEIPSLEIAITAKSVWPGEGW